MNNRVGLHIRLEDSFIAGVEKAVRLQLPFFQCFMRQKSTGNVLPISDQEVVLFNKEYRHKFGHLYIHGSYWINLASLYKNGYTAFKHEIELAKRVSFTHMVLHPGSANGASTRQEGIDAFARSLNTILKYEHDISLIIENTAHGRMSIGSDISDFKLLMANIDYPEKISFALDTAHAFVYGYDISTEKGQDSFIALVKDTIGFNYVSLIHLNDSQKKSGSCVDEHASVGEGLIGEHMLRRFVTIPELEGVPVLLELPVISEEQELTLIEKVVGWLR